MFHHNVSTVAQNGQTRLHDRQFFFCLFIFFKGSNWSSRTRNMCLISCIFLVKICHLRYNLTAARSGIRVCYARSCCSLQPLASSRDEEQAFSCLQPLNEVQWCFYPIRIWYPPSSSFWAKFINTMLSPLRDDAQMIVLLKHFGDTSSGTI